MAPGHQIDETAVLRLKLAEVAAELEHLKRKQVIGEQRFRELLDASPLMVWLSGTDAMGTFFNRSWLSFRGRTLEDVMRAVERQSAAATADLIRRAVQDARDIARGRV